MSPATNTNTRTERKEAPMPTPPRCRPAGQRARLYLLLSFVAAFLLVPASQAFAAHELKLNIFGEPGSSAFVTSEQSVTSSPYEGNPILECSFPSEVGDVCENEMEEVVGPEVVWLETMKPVLGPETTVLKWEVVSGEIFGGCDDGSGTANKEICTVGVREAEASVDAEVNLYLAVPGPYLTLSMASTEGGGGRVINSLIPGDPPIDCTLPEGGSQEGVCENEIEYDYEEGFWFERLKSLHFSPSESGAPNSKFAGWAVTGGFLLPPCSSDPLNQECTVASVTGADVEVTASFDCKEGKECPPPGVPLTINTEVGSGSGQVNCKVDGELPLDEPCAPDYEAGTELELIAAPGEHSEFIGFENGTNDAEECTTSPCGPFTLEEDSELDARFDLIPHELTVVPTGEGSVDAVPPPVPVSGEITGCEEGGGSCSAVYGEGQTVTLEASPGEHKVAEWTNGCDSSVGDTCEVEIPAGDATVEVEFVTAPQGTLTVELTGEGSVSAEEPPAPSSGEISGCEEGGGAECSAEYFQGDTVTLVATPGEHKETVWTGCDSEPSADECEVEIDSAEVTVEVEFAQITHTLTVNTAGSGSGSVSCDGGPCAASYPEGEEVTLTASADSGSSFAGWSGACSGTGACVVTIEADTTVTATFDADATPPPPPPPPPVENCLTNAALCKPGLLIANGVAFVKGNKALLKVRCRGEQGARCRGMAKLIATVKVGGKKKNILVGKTRYNLPTNSAVRVLRAKLTGSGIGLVRRAGQRGLKAKLVGKDVRNRVVKLKQQGGGKKQRRSRR
jgi:hypothetical protein